MSWRRATNGKHSEEFVSLPLDSLRCIGEFFDDAILRAARVLARVVAGPVGVVLGRSGARPGVRLG